MRFLLAIFLLTSMNTRVTAQVFRIRAEVVYCTSHGCKQRTGFGSCVSIGRIDNRQYFLTAGHVFMPKPRRTDIWIDSQWRSVRFHQLLNNGANLDLALVSMEYRPIGAVCLGNREPRPGEVVYVAGFPGERTNGRTRTGRVVSGFPQDLAIAMSAAEGESGGGIFDSQQRLVGIVSGGDQQVVLSTKTTCIVQFVHRVLGVIPDCRMQPPEQSQWEPQSSSQPQIETLDNSEVLKRLDQLENKIDSIQLAKGDKGDKGDRGSVGPIGPPGKDAQWDRSLIRTWVQEEVQTAVSQIELPPGQKGDRGEQGPPGESYDPSEIKAIRDENNELRKRILALENRPTQVGPPGKIEVIIKDSDRVVNRHKDVASGSTVEVDINRFTKGE